MSFARHVFTCSFQIQPSKRQPYYMLRHEIPPRVRILCKRREINETAYILHKYAIHTHTYVYVYSIHTYIYTYVDTYKHTHTHIY